MSKTINFFFQKWKFMEPSGVWYQVNLPDPSNNFCAPSRKSTHALERLIWPLSVHQGAPDIRMSAIYYFITAIVVLLFAFATFFILHRIVSLFQLRIVKIYRFFSRFVFLSFFFDIRVGRLLFLLTKEYRSLIFYRLGGSERSKLVVACPCN